MWTGIDATLLWHHAIQQGIQVAREARPLQMERGLEWIHQTYQTWHCNSSSTYEIHCDVIHKIRPNIDPGTSRSYVAIRCHLGLGSWYRFRAPEPHPQRALDRSASYHLSERRCRHRVAAGSSELQHNSCMQLSVLSVLSVLSNA